MVNHWIWPKLAFFFPSVSDKLHRTSETRPLQSLGHVRQRHRAYLWRPKALLPALKQVLWWARRCLKKPVDFSHELAMNGD
jgi:hypothetical protein